MFELPRDAGRSGPPDHVHPALRGRPYEERVGFDVTTAQPRGLSDASVRGLTLHPIWANACAAGARPCEEGNLAAMLSAATNGMRSSKPATSRCTFKWLRGPATRFIWSSPGRLRNFRQRVEPDFVQLGPLITSSVWKANPFQLSQRRRLRPSRRPSPSWVRDSHGIVLKTTGWCSCLCAGCSCGEFSRLPHYPPFR
jgi:hypothetical protein